MTKRLIFSRFLDFRMGHAEVGRLGTIHNLCKTQSTLVIKVNVKLKSLTTQYKLFQKESSLFLVSFNQEYKNDISPLQICFSNQQLFRSREKSTVHKNNEKLTLKFT